MTTAYIGLGGNLGDRAAMLGAAVERLAAADGVESVESSTPIETEPLGPVDQPKYLNAVAQVETSLGALELLGVLQGIEDSLGRKRDEKWGARTIDLDILLYGQEIIDSTELTVPHSQMHLRSFVLEGLCEIAGQLVHPLLGVTVGQLASRLNGGNFAIDPQRLQLVSVAGIIGVGKTTLANGLGERLGCDVVREPYDTNPFLAEVYAGKTELALDSELYFLVGRMEQLDRRRLDGRTAAVSDYAFDKQPIFARRLLDSQQLALYERLSGPVRERVAEPVLMVYLQDTPQRCLDRIHSRNRPYEQEIELGFLQALAEDYDRLFEQWRICPVIRLSVEQFDCREDDHVDRLVRQVKYYMAGQ